METIESIDTETLKTRKPFSSIFPIHEDTLDSIRRNMETNGFDPVFPIIVWKEEGIVVDGHTRFEAATKVGLETVPVVKKSFENEDDAILYSFHIQRNRRNMSDEDILKCLTLLDKIHSEPERHDQEKAPMSTRKEVNQARAKELGISAGKVDKARKVLEHGDDNIRDSVQSGKKSINQAYNEVQEMRRESGEIKSRPTDGLGAASKYTQALGRLLKELTRLKDQGFKDVPRHKILEDLDGVRELLAG